MLAVISITIILRAVTDADFIVSYGYVKYIIHQKRLAAKA